MKHSNRLQQLKTLFLTQKHPFNSVSLYVKSIIDLGIVILLALSIWFIGPYIAWGEFIPLADPLKRGYLALCIFLIWMLKFLLIDLDYLPSIPAYHPDIRKKFNELQIQFHQLLAALKSCAAAHAVSFRQLPVCLLIGQKSAGKTALLNAAGINYLFPFKHYPLTTSPLNWWMTTQLHIVDVPSDYFGKSKANSYLWQGLLRLLKRQFSHIEMLILVLPLPDLMAKEPQARYATLIHRLANHFSTYHKIMGKHPVCQLVITQCDLLPGFKAFFAEITFEEMNQSWGIALPTLKHHEKREEAFAHHFNLVIKKLNQQLLWRLHQERDPAARLSIKEFPLQMEQLKEALFIFIKELSKACTTMTLQGVYLTSALQKSLPDSIIEHTEEDQERHLQTLTMAQPTSNAYFIKQLITRKWVPLAATTDETNRWLTRSAYIISAALLAFSITLLGENFQQSVNQASLLHNQLSRYQATILPFQNPQDNLVKLLPLLAALQKQGTQDKFKIDLLHIFTFYSHKTEKITTQAYQEALQNILLPNVAAYFADYLQNPVNKNTDYLYAVLKAYLMLGDREHFQADFVLNTFRTVLPKNISAADTQQLLDYLSLALHTNWRPLALNSSLIAETRHYLTALPPLKLSYTILKNIEANNLETPINLGMTDVAMPIFISQPILSQVPNMFTVKGYNDIVFQEIPAAAKGATLGNWVLGETPNIANSDALINALIAQLQTIYINNYVDVWESLLANIHVATQANLSQADEMIVLLIGDRSPLLQLLQTIHDNTFFEPIASASPKLQSLGLMLEKNNAAQRLLFDVFVSLQSLHEYLQTVVNAEDKDKAAFGLLSSRVLSISSPPDAIMQLRFVALKNPEPIKSWLNQIANDTWRLLTQSAGSYLDTSWQTRGMQTIPLPSQLT